MRDEMKLNREHWDEATRLHTTSNCYGIEEFKAGCCRLHRVEVEEVGDVRDRRLLHLQCHFGIDTLSWARRGARVTGVDFSPEAIKQARALAVNTQIEAEFVCSDLYSLPAQRQPTGKFDIVFTSYGVLNWLPDLTPWGELIAQYLAPSGFFYIVEAHPTARMFAMQDDMPTGQSVHPRFPYFHDPAGIRQPPGVDYADPSRRHAVGTHEWQHSMADIVNAITGAGLVVEWIHEYPFCAWPIVAGCEVVERFSNSHGYYARAASEVQLPLLFSLRASLPDARYLPIQVPPNPGPRRRRHRASQRTEGRPDADRGCGVRY